MWITTYRNQHAKWWKAAQCKIHASGSVISIIWANWKAVQQHRSLLPGYLANGLSEEQPQTIKSKSNPGLFGCSGSLLLSEILVPIPANIFKALNHLCPVYSLYYLHSCPSESAVAWSGIVRSGHCWASALTQGKGTNAPVMYPGGKWGLSLSKRTRGVELITPAIELETWAWLFL